MTKKLLAGADNQVDRREITTPSLEQQYVNHFVLKILKLWPEIPLKVKNTAITLLKRFYLRKSIHSYKPKLMMLTALILAFKAEEVNCNLTSFLSRVEGVEAARVMAYEPILLEGAKFQVHVFSPWDSLEGLRLIAEVPNDALYKKIETWIEKTYMTEALLMFSPGVIATAVFLLKTQSVKPLELNKEQMQKVRMAAEMIETGKVQSQNDYKAIVEKVKAFERSCPEFMKFIAEAKKKKDAPDGKRSRPEGKVDAKVKKYKCW